MGITSRATAWHGVARLGVGLFFFSEFSSMEGHAMLNATPRSVPDGTAVSGYRNTPRKPGRVPGPPTAKTSVLLPPDLVEWGKKQPGGLSWLLRRLLTEARQAEQAR